MSAPRHSGSPSHGPAAEPSRDHGTEAPEPSPAPLIEDRKGAGGTRRQVNAARMEVRIRRIALAGLVAAPLGYFITQWLC